MSVEVDYAKLEMWLTNCAVSFRLHSCLSKILLLDIIVYTGVNSVINVSGLEKAPDIVTTLLMMYLQKSDTLFVDKWYSSPELFLWVEMHVAL